MQKISSSAFADSKPHYVLLDGLRGVAALLVIWYHVFEGFATSPIDQKFNHGYLAVDFFFILSGFVIGYAYDDRWKTTMTQKEFFKRRLIRLHPMVVMGAVLGAITFCIQGCEQWDGTRVSISMVMVAMLLNLFLIPAVPGTGPEVRGNGEMYPLNGPSWSLFFEYIGNILYALFIRRLSTKALTILVVIAGIGLASFSIFNLSGNYHLGVGWSMIDYNLIGGFLRMLFAFSIGLLMSRIFKPVHIKGSYPVYIIHYPFMYLFYAWLWSKEPHITFSQSWPVALCVFFGSIVLAYLCLKLYDEPVRKWLSKKFLTKK